MSNLVYYNEKQIEFLQAPQIDKNFICARGLGKTSVISGSTAMKIARLPMAKIFFAAPTYNQILTKTLPPIEEKWNEMGLIEHRPKRPGHYVIGQKPPEGWARAWKEPKKYENVISFWNGFRIELLSLDRMDLIRGGSYDGGEIDEFALVKEDAYDKVLKIMIRGNRFRFRDPLHGQVCKYTSLPWNNTGQWIFRFEELSKAQPDKFLWLEGTTWDNVDVLGADYIRDLELTLPHLVYLVECMNERIRFVENGFYSRFSEDTHVYQPIYNYQDTGDRGLAVISSDDVWPESFLDISFDFSGWFNCAIVFQEKDLVERLKKQFFRKLDGKIGDVVDDICREYKNHRAKFVRVWGEPRGHDRNATGETIFEQIRARFEENGWRCEVHAKGGRTTSHLERHHFMDELLSEQNKNLPKLRINAEGAKDVIIAIKTTDIKANFEKDKSSEKERAYPQEHAPHFTDCIDYYLVQKHYWRYELAPVNAGSGFVEFH